MCHHAQPVFIVWLFLRQVLMLPRLGFVAEDDVHGAPWPTAVVAHFQTCYSLEWETLHIMPRARTPHSASFYKGLFLVCVPKQFRIKQTKGQPLPPLTLPSFDHGIGTKLVREGI